MLLSGAWVRKQEESHLMVRLVLCEREHVSLVRRHQHYRFLPSQPRRGLTGRYLPDAADKAAFKTHEGCCACGQLRVFGSLLMIAFFFFFLEKYVSDSDRVENYTQGLDLLILQSDINS